MTKIILTGPCLGKSYLDNHYSNVYDFDKHTLDYKWDRTGFEHLSDEEFKGLPGRIMKDNWITNYIRDMIDLINSNKYDVVTGIINDDLISELIKSNLDYEIVLYDPKNSDLMQFVKERSLGRGNSFAWWIATKKYIETLYDIYICRSDLNVIILSERLNLSDYLIKCNIKLIPNIY